MAGAGQKRRLRARIRRRHGVSAEEEKVKPKKLIRRADRTLAMDLMEAYFEAPLEELLTAGSLRVVGERLSLDKHTVSKWRERLGLRDSFGTSRVT